MRPKARSAHHAVARIAARQHGVVTVGQLLGAGLTRDAVKRRVAQGLLHRELRGVYRVGHRAPNIEARYMAAVLACGPEAVLSGRAAAYLSGFLKGRAPAPEVTATGNRRLPRILTHRVRRLDPRDVTRCRGIPVTTAARTLLDLAGVMSLDDLARAAHEAQVRRIVDAKAIAEALARRPNTKGAWKLREIFRGEVRVTLSELERAFLALLRSARLPLPRTNRPTGTRYVDCQWPEHRLVVELDSYRYHHSRHAWEQDRRREREARARGNEFRRYTYGDVTEDRTLVEAELCDLLPQVVASA
jgi:very-short-patch-repair endonuclease